MTDFAREFIAQKEKYPDKQSFIDALVMSPLWEGNTPSAQGLDKRREYLAALWDAERIEPPKKREEGMEKLRIQEAIWNLEERSAALTFAIKYISDLDLTDENATDDLNWEQLCDALKGMQKQADGLYKAIKELSRKCYSAFGLF